MQRKAFVFMLLVAGTAMAGPDAEYPADFSGNYWFRQCDPAVTAKYLECAAYVRGVIEGAQAHAAITESRDVFCLPKGVEVGQSTDVFIDYLKKNPGYSHFPGSALVFRALANAFPCKK